MLLVSFYIKFAVCRIISKAENIDYYHLKAFLIAVLTYILINDIYILC
jgi:hypothetical protein